ncbi:hypothetical protein [Vibrio barjaei]|uniref:hypothetical protein n=1 Tax=Vibrio barjaei TaxID=1676683 RepID=UPI002284EF2E|nr:hypothetical protein [Vibrio barjaei]MCY9870460.1 hypothetical protein [Vibrio barjaei]
MEQFYEIFNRLPKAITIYGTVVAYVELDDVFYTLARNGEGSFWYEVEYDREEIAAIVDDGYGEYSRMVLKLQGVEHFERMEHPLSVVSLSTQIDASWPIFQEWKAIKHSGKTIGYKKVDGSRYVLLESAELTRSHLTELIVYEGEWYAEGYHSPKDLTSSMYDAKGFLPHGFDVKKIPAMVSRLKEWELNHRERRIEL